MEFKHIVKRGLEANLPILDEGEIAYTTDTKIYWVGSPDGNIPFSNKSDVEELVSGEIGVVNEQLAENAQDIFNKTKTTQVPYNYDGCVVTIQIDDGLSGFDTLLKPVLDSKGVKASLAIITNDVGTSSRLSLERLKQLQDDGFEIICHSKTHDANIFNYSTVDLSTVPDSAIETEFRDAQKWMIDNGFKGFDSLVFPWGNFHLQSGQDIRYKMIARKYFKYAFSTLNLLNTSPVDNMYMSRFYLKSGMNFDTDIKTVLDNHIQNKSWLNIFTHSTSSDFDSTLWTQAIDYLQSNGIPILTVGEAIKYKGNAVSIGEYKAKSDRVYIGNDGKSIGIPIKIIEGIYPTTADVSMDSSITSYEKYKTTITQIVNTSDTFLGHGGVLTTYRGEEYYHYQTYVSAVTGRLYVRKWRNADATGSWGSWVGNSMTSGNVTRLNTTTITDFPYGIEYHDISNSNRTGFPEEIAGTLITYRSQSGDIHSYQEYHIRQTNKVYKRYPDVNNSYLWTPWVKISAV